MAATKSIPVSEETWKKLRREKDSGQTWDQLLQKLQNRAKKSQVAEKSRTAKDSELETTALENI